MVALALGVGLSGCGGGKTVGETLGYQQNGPDEMSVVKRPPLTVPPDFNLRPPRPGEPRSTAGVASKAARETLIGPATELAPATLADPGITPVNVTAPSEATSAGKRAKAALTGKEQGWQRYHKSPPVEPKEEEVAELTEVAEAQSAGQSALLSHTNRVERDLDALNETRAENRVDGALLRRLLTWQPTPTGADAATPQNDGVLKSESIVRIVRREQTPVHTALGLE